MNMDWATLLWIAVGTVTAIAVSVSLSTAIAAEAIKIIFKTLDDRLNKTTEVIEMLISPNKQ